MEKLPGIARRLAAGTYLRDCRKGIECSFLKSPSDAGPSNSDSKHVIVEFSSPNIAKPFHVGHLRSTLIGRFIGTLLKRAGHKVTTINYLGDWGVQFGILARGFKEFGNIEKLQCPGKINNENPNGSFDPLNHLLDVYVSANQRAKDHPEFLQEAKAIFTKMEQGDGAALKFWEEVKEISIQEFSKFYDRMGIEFDFWHGERMYSDPALEIVAKGKERNQLVTSESAVGVPNGDSFIPLARSDGSTLYLTRDVAAVLDREAQFHPDMIVYVVERGQERHFQHLKLSLECLGYGDLAEKVRHVPFGRIQGMSTRTGNVVFVKDLLAAGMEKMMDMLKSDPNTKASEAEMSQVAEALTVCALSTNDMKEKRQHDYKFSWDRALQARGDTGVYLQSTHAKLSTLMASFPYLARAITDNSFNFEPDLVQEPEALKLALSIENFSDFVEKAYKDLEPCHVLQGMYKGITQKLDEKFVKHQESEFSMEWNPKNVELSIKCMWLRASMEWNPNVELSSACGCAQPHALDSSTFGFHSIENSDS